MQNWSMKWQRLQIIWRKIFRMDKTILGAASSQSKWLATRNSPRASTAGIWKSKSLVCSIWGKVNAGNVFLTFDGKSVSWKDQYFSATPICTLVWTWRRLAQVKWASTTSQSQSWTITTTEGHLRSTEEVAELFRLHPQGRFFWWDFFIQLVYVV